MFCGDLLDPKTSLKNDPMTNPMTVDISNRKIDAMTNLMSDPRFKTSKIKRELEILMSGQISYENGSFMQL